MANKIAALAVAGGAVSGSVIVYQAATQLGWVSGPLQVKQSGHAGGPLADSGAVVIVRTSTDSAPSSAALVRAGAPEGTDAGSPVHATASGRMVFIAEGTFGMGSSEDEVTEAIANCRRERNNGPRGNCSRSTFSNESPRHDVHLRAFRMDATEVANEEFVHWLAERPGVRVQRTRRNQLGTVSDIDGILAVLFDPVAPITASSGISSQNGRPSVRAGFERMPAVFVTWRAASEYCHHRGARLPSEAEWEFAARGATRRRYPWGDDPPRVGGTIFGLVSVGPVFADVPGEGSSRTQDVTPAGVFDLGGNVSEWTADVFAPYEACSGPCESPTGPSQGTRRVVRGGDGYQLGGACRAAGRAGVRAEDPFPNVGFRCVEAAR